MAGNSIYQYRATYPDGRVFEGDLNYMARHFGVTTGKAKVAYLSRGKTLEEAFNAPAGVEVVRWDAKNHLDPRREAKFTRNPVVELNNRMRVNYTLGKYHIYQDGVRLRTVTDPIMIDMIDRLWGL